MARFTDWINSLTAKTTTLDGTESVPIYNTGGTTQKATLLDALRYVLANGFSATDININHRYYVRAASKTLTESTATGVVDIAVAAGSVASGEFFYSVQANDATDFQVIRGRVVWAVVNKGGTLTTSITDTVEANPVSAGTLTCAATLVNGTNKVTLSLNAVSSLTQTTLRARWRLEHDGYATITAL